MSFENMPTTTSSSGKSPAEKALGVLQDLNKRQRDLALYIKMCKTFAEKYGRQPSDDERLQIYATINPEKNGTPVTELPDIDFSEVLERLDKISDESVLPPEEAEQQTNALIASIQAELERHDAAFAQKQSQQPVRPSFMEISGLDQRTTNKPSEPSGMFSPDDIAQFDNNFPEATHPETPNIKQE